MSAETCNLECDRSFLDPGLFSTHVQIVHPDEFASAQDEAAKAPSGANAPYKILPAGKKFVVKNNAGETKATFDTRQKALDYLQALYANVKGAAKRAAKTPFTGKAKNRVPTAKASLHVCTGADCAREFLTEEALADHAEAVHTFDDIRQMVADVVRERYYQRGDYRANPPIEGQWAWLRDIAQDWCVFEVSKGEDTTLYKASYSIESGVVTLGDAVETTRRTVYETNDTKASS